MQLSAGQRFTRLLLLDEQADVLRGDLLGLEGGEGGLQGDDLGGEAVDGDGQFAQAGVLRGDVSLGGGQFIGGADGQLLDGGAEVITLDGEGDAGRLLV